MFVRSGSLTRCGAPRLLLLLLLLLLQHPRRRAVQGRTQLGVEWVQSQACVCVRVYICVCVHVYLCVPYVCASVYLVGIGLGACSGRGQEAVATT